MALLALPGAARGGTPLEGGSHNGPLHQAAGLSDSVPQEETMKCTVCKKSIYSRVRHWNQRPMCRKCYGYFTGHVHVVRRALPRNPVRPKRATSLLRRLFSRLR
jgi:hypothetical protein